MPVRVGGRAAYLFVELLVLDISSQKEGIKRVIFLIFNIVKMSQVVDLGLRGQRHDGVLYLCPRVVQLCKRMG